MLQCYFVIFFILFASSISASTSFEGIYDDIIFGGKLETIARFLPYNPKTLCVSDTMNGDEEIRKFFSKADRYVVDCSHVANVKILVDLLWIDGNSNISILANLPHITQKCTIVYATIRNNEDYKIKELMENHNFLLICLKRFSEDDGYAIFLRKDVFDVIRRSLNHTDDVPSTPLESILYTDITRYFKKAKNKEGNHSYYNIDYIYMINLDERPEKYTSTAKELEPYKIFPYRFSAVNGWKLSSEIINQLGVKFANLPPKDLFATAYRLVEGKEYKSNEVIWDLDQTYFLYSVTRGGIGIILSHLSILQDAFDSGYNLIWIMEDDVLVIKEPQELMTLIDELNTIDPDWDILFTDVDSKDKQGTIVPCRAVALRPNISTEPLSFFLEKFYPVSEKLSRCGMRYGAYSMIVRRSGMEKILNYFKKNQLYLPYDMDFWMVPTIKMYCPNYEIVSTLPSALSDNLKPDYK